MNYSTDKPIETENKDLLSRSSFSKQLGKGIYEYNDKSGLVIGLFGKWGTGKTSVINMAEEEINRLSQTDENKPLIMKFSPWNYSDKDNLISLFFQNLKVKISLQDNEQIKIKLGKALSDYADAFEVLSYIPYIGSGLATGLKTVAKRQGENLMEIPDLDETRKILEDELVKLDKKVIIVIDDIDRLTNSQTRDIFQLVKQVADFPNIIYILVMDREVAQRALIDVHNIDGNEYLDKIIQVPLELPEIRKTKLQDILIIKLHEILKEASYKAKIDGKYWGRILINCISPYINNLRDVNRVLNTFQFRYGILQHETSFEDLIAITTLEVLEPKLYKWICNNKEAVCGTLLHSTLSNFNSKVNYKKLYCDEFENMGLDSNRAIKCLSTLFPVFAKDVRENSYNRQSEADVRRNMGIAHQERFELYFMFNLDNIKVSRKIINDFIYKLEYVDLLKYIEEINDEEKIGYFLEEINSLVNKVPYNRLSLIASVLLLKHGEFNGRIQKSILSISAEERASFIIEEVLERLNTEEEKYNVLCSSLRNIRATGLGAITKIIINIERSHGRLVENSKCEEKQIISLFHLNKMEDIFLEKVKIIVKSTPISNIKNFRAILYLWKFLDEEGVYKYIRDLFVSEVNKLKFITTLSYRWEGTNGVGWEFYENDYRGYISNNEIYTSIENFDKDKLYEFTEDEQIKLASFVGNFEKNGLDIINEKEAKEILNQWKSEKKEDN